MLLKEQLKQPKIIWILKEIKMNILYQGMEQVFVKNTWGFTSKSFLGIFIAMVAVVCIIAFIMAIKDWDAAAVPLFVLFLLFAFLSTLCFHQKPVYKDVMTYQVTLDDSYSYNQLIEQYDVIETKGQILTVREKGWDDDIPKEGD